MAEALGKYEIRRQLGTGAMGTVYEGWDPFIERLVAIKTVQLPKPADEEMAEAVARFRREAQAAGRLVHPNIVGVFDYGETDELAYIVMELVDGPTLKSLLDSNRKFPLTAIVRIMRDLLEGLQFSHERGVVHRDIKPANIMLTKKGQAKIADFGIARIENSIMTQAGTMLGTPAYMSPEQFMGLVVDARTDIYSAGVLLYQLLTGERPFDGGMTAIMHKALHTDPPAPSGIAVTVPRALDAVVLRAMAKRPEDRFPCADDFMTAIRAAIAVPMPATESEATIVRPARKVVSQPDDVPIADRGTQRTAVRPSIAAAGLACLAVAGGLGYFFMAGTSPKPIPVAEPVGPAIVSALPPAAVPPVVAPMVAPVVVAPVVVAPVVVAPVVVAPVAPSPPEPAPPSPRERAKTAALSLPCAVLIVADGPRVSGLAQAGLGLDRLLADLRGIGPLTENITLVDRFACEPIAALSDSMRASWNTMPPAVVLRAAQREAASGARLAIDVTTAQPSLHLDIFRNDGSVRHLARLVRPDTLTYTTSVSGLATGIALIVALGTAESLNMDGRPEVESAADYLPILRSRLRAGAPVFADVAMVTVRPPEAPAAKVRPAEPAAAKPPPQRPQVLRSSRCSNILSRAQLGETLSDDELKALRTECRS